MRRALALGAAAGAACGLALLLSAPSAGPPPSGPPVVDVLVNPRSGPATVATGFHSGDGRVVTVAHLLPGRQARVLALDRRADLALLAVRAGVRAPSPLPGTGSPHLLVRRGGRSEALPVKVRRRIDARIRPRPGAVSSDGRRKGDTVIEKDDHVILFAASDDVRDVERLFAVRLEYF